MTAGCFDRDAGLAWRNAAAVFACLVLTVCAAPPTNWVKAGADNATTSHEAADCQTQANAALAKEQGINQDITATLGGNWQASHTTTFVDQSMREQATGYADQIFNSCMRAKGFKKEG
jgi:hypothetical protein